VRLLFLLLPQLAIAQQLPVLNQSLFNPYLLNPAYAGMNPYTQVFLNVRDQWSGMPGAPFFYSLSADGRLRNERSGIGFQLQGDRQPLIHNISGMFTYRHLVKIGQSHSIRLALSGGLLYNSIDLANADASSPTESTLMERSNSKAAFDVHAGLVYRFRKLELGFAALQLNNSYYRYVNSATGEGLTYKLIRCFNAHASYRFDAGGDWNITPSAILYSTQGMPAYALASCRVEYLGDYWLAAGYRTDRSIAVSCGVAISGRLCLGYSFEAPVNRYASVIGNTHEVTVGIRLFGRSGEPAGRREVSRKEVEQLSNAVQLQSQQIDELTEETGRLKDDAAKQQQRYDSQRAELETLIARTAAQTSSQRDEMEKVRDGSLTPEQLADEPSPAPEAGRYAVIAGAYNSLDDARLYRKILERELGIVTWVHERRGGQVRFLVYTRIVRTKAEAQGEYDRLYDLNIERYKQGSLWLYQLK
jgi:type IX secretion system PorP/SprF family membrane protein